MAKVHGNSSNQSGAPNVPKGKTIVSHTTGSNWTERLDAARARREMLRAQTRKEANSPEADTRSLQAPEEPSPSPRATRRKPDIARAPRELIHRASRDIASGTLVVVSLCSMVIGFALGASSQGASSGAAVSAEGPDLTVATPPAVQTEVASLPDTLVEQAFIQPKADAESPLLAAAMMADKTVQAERPKPAAVGSTEPLIKVTPSAVTTWDFTKSDGPSQGLAPSLVVEPVWLDADPERAAKANILAVAPEAAGDAFVSASPAPEEVVYAMPAVTGAQQLPAHSAEAPSYAPQVDAVLAALMQEKAADAAVQEVPTPAPANGPLKARVYAPTSIAYASLDGTLSRIVESGAELSQVERIDMEISTPHIRYFYPQDANRAIALGQSLNLDVRNFEHVAAGGAGRIEVWLKGTGWERALVVEEEQAALRRTGGLARVFGGSLSDR